MDESKCEGTEFGIGEVRWRFATMLHILLSRENLFMKEGLDSRAMSRESGRWKPPIVEWTFTLARDTASGSLEPSGGGIRISTCSDSDASFPKTCMERGGQSSFKQGGWWNGKRTHRAQLKTVLSSNVIVVAWSLESKLFNSLASPSCIAILILVCNTLRP